MGLLTLTVAFAAIAFMPLGSGNLQSLLDRFYETQPNPLKLGDYPIKIESVSLNRNSHLSTPPPRALVSVRVQLTNLDEVKSDLLLRVSLKNDRGDLISEATFLMYVPQKKTNVYDLDLLVREAGNLYVIAEVTSRGKSAKAEPKSVNVSVLDLLL